ncbi:hypothetical protein D9619_006856 [Psilocybe cf. subviscida]|uniref:Zn(2)-C6 fungal-type domain-containing protein n=1 Tax=Psilocybe cf. subviscida TaxID=2480587 RepID=A0A8H5B4F9_9AGAR|nr:hypothetical protein D9619_006856 [Psilocybe cf. subviscida]
MPVDTTRVASPRRTQKKLTEEELKDIDRKRLLGELSCAECRRLKLRCDKKLPCGSCYRRGCESICPLGILAAGQGTRFILADTQQLHDKIYEMSNRIRQLEDALAILQSTVSDQRHPLLNDDLLKIKFGSEAINARENHDTDEEDQTGKSIDALGTLTLGSAGEMHYFGRSAGSETLMVRANEDVDELSDDDSQIPPDLAQEVDKLADLFPFSTKIRPDPKGLELVKSSLPPRERAQELCKAYIEHASYFFRPIKAGEPLDLLLISIYGKQAGAPEMSSEEFDRNTADITSNIPHSLATLYFVFALGSLLDLNLKPFNGEAEKYYDLGRASLSLRTVYDSPNMFSVKALGLMATYHSLAGRKYSRDSAWCVMSFAAKLAQSIGLHRDSARWRMDNKTVQRRRNLFWEVFSADVSHSLALGRPPAIHLSYVDCEYPIDDDASLSNAAEHQTGFWHMKHLFARDIYYSVAESTLVARSPSYSTILDLDRKVREVSFPPKFNPYASKDDIGAEAFHSSSLSLRDFYASQHPMMYLHRSFFAQAMLDHPTNPLLSPFAPSFLTAYRSASVIIKACVHHFERCAAMAMRLWFLMNHVFSAAVIVGTVVTRSPNSNIASIALRDFNMALMLFEKTAEQSQRAKVALGILLKLKEKAIQIYEKHSELHVAPAAAALTDDFEDDLAIFGGQLKILDRKDKGHRRTASSPPTSSSSPHTISSGGTSPILGAGFNFGLPDVHPSLIAYLNQDAVKKTMDVDPLGRPNGNSIFGSTLQQISNPQRQTQIELDPQVNSMSQAYERASQTQGTAARTAPVAAGSPGAASSSSSNPASPQHAPSALQSRTFSAAGANNHSSQQWPSSSVYESLLPRPASSTALQRVDPPQYQRISQLINNTGTGALPAVDFSQQYNVPPNATGYLTGAQQLRPGYDYSNYGYTTSAVPGNPTGTNISNFQLPLQYGGSATNIAPNLDFWSNQQFNTNMDTSGAIDMGLSSESGMDAGWISFMRDCGIMDVSGDKTNG